MQDIGLKSILKLYENGQFRQEFMVQSGQIFVVGSEASEVTLTLDDPSISSRQAVIIQSESSLILSDHESKNGTYVNQAIVREGVHVLGNGDKISFGKCDRFLLEVEQQEQLLATSYQKQGVVLSDLLSEADEVTIGREGTFKIDDPQKYVSRLHAIVRKSGNSVTIEDQSLNGTYVNGRRIPQGVRIEIDVEDTILIGLYAITLGAASRDLTEEPAILAQDIEKCYKTKHGKSLTALYPMDLQIARQEFVALMGPSGCGKSTLLKVLNRNITPSSGKVYIHGLELSENFDLLKRKIGYVPQDDIIHKELTVYKTLYFAAKLRMGAEINEQTIQRKIDEVLGNLNIDQPELRNKKVADLSGGQRKRVSIAVELLNDPSILFLDEPTSPLDPETIKDFLHCICELTQKGIGTTVVMVTHKPEDLQFVDKVIFLTAQGYQAYFGKHGADMHRYFGVDNIIDIYSNLSNSDSEKGRIPIEWNEKWRSFEKRSFSAPISQPIPSFKESYWWQFIWLTKRYLEIKLKDHLNLKLLIAQPVIISILISIIFSQLQLGVLFLMAISAIWFGVNNAAKEIVSEQPIYRRERNFNLNLSGYLFSKMVVLSLVALVQVLIFVGILWIRYSQDPVTFIHLPQYLLLLFFLAVSATMLGLLLSSLTRNAEQVMTIVPIVLIPQIMLAGVVTKIDTVFKELLSYLTLGRWGTESLARIQDSSDAYEVTKEIVKFNPEVMPPDTVATNQHMIYQESLYHPILKPLETDTLWHMSDGQQLIPYRYEMDLNNMSGAMELLDFYAKDATLLRITETAGLTGPVLAITLLNVSVFSTLYFTMLSKDRE